MLVPEQINAAQGCNPGDMRKDRANSHWVFQAFDVAIRRSFHMTNGEDSGRNWGRTSPGGGMDLSCARSLYVRLVGIADETGAKTVRSQVSTMLRMKRPLEAAGYILSGSKASRMMRTPACLAEDGCHTQRNLM